MKRVILASKSPRRDEILNELKIKHICISSNAEELSCGMKPSLLVEENAYIKAADIFKDHSDDLVIGADTIVVINDLILGKPKDYSDAVRMLKLLSGKKHQVMTGVCVMFGDNIIRHVEITDVYFDDMSDEVIDTYIKNDNVYDKAGSYAIQSEHNHFVNHIDGSYSNVVGLPKEYVKKVLDEIL